MEQANMRSPRGFAASLILLFGVLLAAIVALVIGNGADAIIHLTLGASFLLIALAVFDFKLPVWVALVASAATGVLAIVFLLQGASDITHSVALAHLAYGLLGQRLEKMLGYVFLLWCLVLFLMDSEGKTKILGAVVIVAVFSLELYSYGMTYLGSTAPAALKLLYIMLFIWLLLESRKPPNTLNAID
jgi:hypothetical protein